MPLFLPVLTGLLLAGSFPLCDQHYLAWVAFIPLMAYLLRVKSKAAAFCGGYVAGAIQFFILLVWMPAVLEQYGGLSGLLSWTGYGLLILLLSCFPGMACLCTKVLMRRGGPSLLLMFPAIWVLIEFLQTGIPFGGFPWLPMGYSQSEQLALIQVADLTGVFGVSFLLVWVSAALCHLGFQRGRGIRAWWPLIAGMVLLFSSVLYGRASMERWEDAPREYRVVMLQGNLSQDDSLAVLREKYLTGYERMLEAEAPEGGDLLILPESPTPVIYRQESEYQSTLEKLARRFTFGMIFNNIRVEDGGGGTLYYNSAYYLDGAGAYGGSYDKIHLVPFGEYVPAKDLLVFMRTITQDVGEFKPGQDHRLFSLNGHRVNATICFEAIFPGLVREFVGAYGSELIVNLTNDGWYGASSAPFQHFNIARWRAIENRRYFLRAANTGISAVIDPSGRIQGATAILSQAVCEGDFGFVSEQTFYTRYGDAFILLCAIIVFGCTILVYANSGKTGPRRNGKSRGSK